MKDHKLKCLLYILPLWFVVLALELTLLHTGVLQGICLFGVFGTMVFIVLAIVRSNQDHKDEIGKRIKQANQFVSTRYHGKVKASELNILQKERRDNPFFAEHKIKGNLEISGMLREIDFQCRELYIYDTSYSKTDRNLDHNKKFSGTSVSWLGNYSLGEQIICTLGFSKFTAYSFKKLGYKKFTSKNATVFVRDEKDMQQLEQFIRLYEKACRELMKPLEGMELCLWHKNGRIEIFICQILSTQNSITNLMGAIEKFLLC